ncbi:hypothetical protein AB0P17_42595 [Streptomyces sp. NPDC088124]|uniref:hypothetical protein n=1 Tax=Streptomyces sp. NPDC088124 TaxID=3154654 RepID=UPI003422C303
MLSTATGVPTTPARLAGLLLDPTVDDRVLAAQVGAQPARRLLAAAHRIAADRLWNAA